jgi:hypothetical protein
VVLGENAVVSPHLIAWHVLTDHPDAGIVPDPINTKKEKFRKEALTARIDRLAERYPLLRTFERVGARQVYHIDHAYPRKRGLDPATVLDSLLDDIPDRILLLEITPESPWYSPEGVFYTSEEFTPLLAARTDYVPASTSNSPMTTSVCWSSSACHPTDPPRCKSDRSAGGRAH